MNPQTYAASENRPESPQQSDGVSHYLDCATVAIDANRDLVIAVSASLTALFTLTLWLVTSALARIGERQETMARTHERAYVFGGGPFNVVDKPGMATMSIENYGRTPAFVKTVEWGLCDEKKFPKTSTVSELIDNDLLPSGVIKKVTVENVIPPNQPATTFSKDIEFNFSGNLGKIFFGRFIYRDVFNDPHHSTFKLRLVGSGSDPLEGCYADWS